MKKILVLFSVIVIAVLAYRTGLLESVINYFPCDTPIKYSVGTVDARFNLDTTAFKADISQAAALWSQQWGKPLFQYDPQAVLSINLVYDERQGLTTSINQLESSLHSGQEDLQKQNDQFEKLQADFKARLEVHNRKVAMWNEKGGAPEQEFKNLSLEEATLKTDSIKLNEMARQLNRSADQYNTQVGQLNQNVDRFNSDLTLKPEEGLYLPSENRIEIYFNTSKNELVHTLAHELGHSRGLDHNTNQDSIMYPFNTGTTALTEDDIISLNSVCQKQNWVVLGEDKLFYTYNQILHILR